MKRYPFVLVLLFLLSSAWGAVSSEVTRTDAVGNGATAVYSFTFPVKATSELRVFIEDADGHDSELALGVDYTATLNTSGTGSITLTAGSLANGLAISIQRGIPYTQTYNPAAAGAYNAASLGVALDRLSHEVLRLKGDVARAIKVPYLDPGGDSVTKLAETATERASQSLVFDSSGNVMVGSATTATASVYGQSLIDDANAAAARTTLGIANIGALDSIATRTLLANDTGATGPPLAVGIDALTSLTTGSTTRRSLGARFVSPFNVKDYGATGDGATDDRAALQAAITAAGTGDIFVPPGTYLISSPIVLSASCRIFGTGRASIIRRTTAGNLLEIGTAGLASRIDGTTVADLAFTSPGNVGVQSAISIVASTPGTKQNIAVRRCSFSGFAAGANANPITSSPATTRADYARSWYTSGLWTDYLAQSNTPEVNPTTASKAIEILGNTWTVEVADCYIDGCNIGVYAANLGAGPVDYITVRGCTINSGALGILAVNINTIRIWGNTIEFNYAGATIYGCRLLGHTLNQMEGNDLHHVYGGSYSGNSTTNGEITLNKFQPRDGTIANQQNDIVLAGVDTLSINRNGYGGVNTAAQDANHGWNTLVRTALCSRILVDTAREESDGAFQITGTSKVETEVRKIGGASRAINRRRVSLSMQDSLNTQFEPFFYRHQTDINGLAAPATYSLDFVVPTGLKLYVMGYGIEVTSLAGGGVATQLVGSIVQGAGNNIVRLTSVTLSNAAAVNERSVVNIAADVNRLFPAGSTLQFQVTVAATGPATYTVRPICWGFLCP